MNLKKSFNLYSFKLYSFPLLPLFFFTGIFQFAVNHNDFKVAFFFLFQLPRILYLSDIYILFFLNIENDKNSYETKNGHVNYWILDVLSNDSCYRRERSTNKINDAVSLSSHKDREKVLVNMVTKVLDRANLQP